MKKLFIISSLLLGACASHTNEIQTQYVSPLQYQAYNCGQISTEMQRVSARVSQAGGTIEQKAGRDDAQMGVGLILFWPTLFFLDGDGPEAQEYGRLKGEFDALERTAIDKSCGINVEDYRPKVQTAQAEPDSVKPKSAKERLK